MPASASHVCQIATPLEMRFHIRHRSEEHTSELQSQSNLVCRLLLEKKKQNRLTVLYRSRTSHPRCPLRSTLNKDGVKVTLCKVADFAGASCGGSSVLQAAVLSQSK